MRFSGPQNRYSSYMLAMPTILRVRVPRPTVPVPSRRVRARRAIVFGAAFTVLLGVVGIGLIEKYRLDTIDREYAQRLELLQTATAEHPDRPLMLAVGSSRMVHAFSPELLPPLTTADSRTALPFNYGHFGAGPIYSYLALHRLFEAGVRPKWVLFELMPGFFPRENARMVSSLCTAGDAIRGGHYYPTGELEWEYTRWRTVRLPDLASRAVKPIEFPTPLGPLGGYGAHKKSVTPEERAALMTQQAGHFSWVMRNWKPSDGGRRAIFDSLELCRKHGAEVRFVVLPEGGDHRAMYGPGSIDRVDEHLRKLADETGIPITDTRGWLTEDDFTDSHHELERGAIAFTDRLGRELLEPWVAASGSK